MKIGNANKVISVLLSVAMCPMMVPSAAFAADDDAASDASSPSEQTQSADQAEGVDAGASLNDTIAPQSEATGEASDEAADEAAPAAAATVNGYSTLEEAVQNATVDAQGVITYEVTGKVSVDSTGWVQVRPAAATNAKVVKFVGKSADAEICITQGAAILADQGSSALSVEFSNLKLSKLNPTYAGDYGHATNYFTTWLRNMDAASNCVTYTNCEFPNGVCNNQYGKTVFDSCTFTNTVTKLYNMWVYGGNVEVKGGSFTGVRGLKVYTEGTATVAPKVDIAGASFAGVSEKAAIVVSKPATVTLSNVSATDCAKGLIQKDIEGSSEEVTLNANGTGIGGNFDITTNTGSDATKAEFNLNAGTLTSEVSSDFLADGFTLSKSSDGTFGVAEAAPAGVAEVNGVNYASLQEAVDAARSATVKLLADTKENVTISTNNVTLDLNGHTLNGSTGERKPALTVTARGVTVKDSSETQTGTIMREDTAETSGVSSHYVIDVQGNGWLTFESGNVTNNSGNAEGKGASLVRVGDDSVAKYPGLNIKGGTFTQDNFIVIKVDRGDLFLNGGTLNSANSYAIENWHRATVKGGTVNGAVAAWTYSGGHNSDLAISGGTINGDVKSVTYDGAGGKTAKVSITGGVVNGTLNTFDYSTGTTSNDPTKATIEVTSGTFSTDPSRYLIEGSAATPNGDGSFGVAKAYLAQVGENSYYTMGEAFDAQTKTGKAITLLRDYTTGSTFNSGTVARVVDLNGHTWTCTGTDANSAAFEINNPNASLTVMNGKVVSSQLVGLIPSAMGGTIKYDNSTLTFDRVEATTSATSGIETNGNNTNDIVVLKDSTLNVPNGYGIYFPSSGTLTIDNSTINAKTMGAQVCSGNLNVTAGSAITVSGDPVEKLEGDGAIQDGAAISIVDRAGYKGLGQIAITGGTFTAKTGNAALKACTWDSATKQESAFDNSAKTVAVSGGTFSSAVSADLCAEGYAPVENDDDTYGVGTVVAEAAGKQYASLYDAVHAVKWGGTVKLLADAESPYTLVCSGKVTFDLGEYTITNTNKSGIASVIKATSGAVVTVNATTGGIDAGSGATNNFAFYANSGTVIVNGGNYTVGLDKNGGGNSVAYADKARGKGPGTIRVNGGTFEAAAAKNGHSYVLNAKDGSGCTIEVKGGTFKNFDPSNNISEGEGTNFVPAGYAVTAVENGFGTLYTVSQAVVQVGTKAFASLQTAIDAAQDGETVTLLTDIVLDAQAGTESTLYPQFTISGKKLTLDMQGHKISYSEESRTKDYGKASLLTLSIDKGSDVTITGNGTIDTELGSNQAYGINILDGSNLTINNGTFYGAMTAVQVQKGGLVINDGTFLMAPTCKEQVPQYAKYIINCIDAAWKDGSATVSIKGGTFGHDYSHSPEGEGTSYLAPGYAPVNNGDGTYGVAAAVARIGSSAYASVQAAINAAQEGDTVQLLADDVVDDTVIVQDKGAITLDLNGKTISNTKEIRNEDVNNWSLISVRGNSDLTITGNGAVDALANDSYAIDLQDAASKCTIESGTFTGNISAAYIMEGALTINGGTFDIKQMSSQGDRRFTINCYDSNYKSGVAQVSISGGTFNGFDPANNLAEGTGTTFTASGYTSVANADGTYGVVAGVAQIGTKAYTSLQAAVDAAQDGETIQLLNDTTENITINASKQITLDLNGHTLNGGTGTANAAILNKGNVTITDTSAGKTGTIKRDDQGIEGETSYYVIKNIGTMVIDQANVVNNSGYKKANSSGSMVGSSLICNGDDDPQASLTINGGTFNQPNFLVVKNGTNGTLTVNGGTLTSNHSAVQNWNKAQILGGSLTGQIWTDAWVEGAIGETIIGGDAQFTGEIVVDITGKVPPTLKIEGGSLDVTSWRVTSAAAAANATVAVSGGTFTAAVPENYCAEGYAPVDNGDGTYGVKLAEGAYLLQNYRTGDQASWTYPTKDGMAFAGWYKDASFTTPCAASDVEGAAYAKFVPITDLLKFKGGSLRMDKGVPSESTYLRFGYTKAIPEGTTYIENGWYYKRISAPTSGDRRLVAYNNALNNDGTITSNLVFNGVAKNYYTANFTEKAFVKYMTVDGTTVEAVEDAYHSRSVSEVADAILAHPMASEAEKDYATSIKSAIQ